MASVCASSSSALGLSRSLRAFSGELAGTGAQSFQPPASCSAVTALGAVSPLASRRCDLTGKRANNGYRVSHSHHRTKHLQGVNLQYKRLWWAEANRFVKMRLSTKAIKTVEKKGLSAMAKDAGINLLDYAV